MDVIKAGFAVLLSVFSNLAFAAPITGSFSGLADGWRMSEFGQSFYEDEPITGSFVFPTEFDDATIYEGPGSVMYFQWPVAVSFDLFEFTASYSPDPDTYAYALTLEELDERQTAQLWFFAAYSNAALTFVAPHGGLFANFDPRTFNPLAVDVAASHADFSMHTRNDGASVRFDRISFDGFTPTPVPAPMTLALFSTGLLGLGWMRLGRSSRAKLS